ncbi:UNVERIFIED_CONTAM: hypothetical protein FKN15_028268 [Acipenser sinensis]
MGAVTVPPYNLFCSINGRLIKGEHCTMIGKEFWCLSDCDQKGSVVRDRVVITAHRRKLTEEDEKDKEI